MAFKKSQINAIPSSLLFFYFGTRNLRKYLETSHRFMKECMSSFEMTQQ